MNQIQLISRNILCERLKMQMGLDLEVDIEPRILQAMWRQLRHERIAERNWGQSKINTLQLTGATSC